jgi:hypothetical protein
MRAGTKGRQLQSFGVLMRNSIPFSQVHVYGDKILPSLPVAFQQPEEAKVTLRMQSTSDGPYYSDLGGCFKIEFNTFYREGQSVKRPHNEERQNRKNTQRDD